MSILIIILAVYLATVSVIPLTVGRVMKSKEWENRQEHNPLNMETVLKWLLYIPLLGTLLTVYIFIIKVK